MCSAISASRVELDCSVLEEDWQRGQSYMAHWQSLTLIPHLHSSTVMKTDRSAKHWEARRLLQRFLSGAISKNYPHPKTKQTRLPHQPISDPSAMRLKVQRGPVPIQNEVCYVSMRPKSAVLETSERKTMVKSTVLETSERKTMVKITMLPRFLG